MAHGFQEGYALIVGIAGYQSVNPLPAAVLDDARDIAGLLRAPAHAGYPKQNVRVLLDRQATAAAMRDGLDWLSASAGPGKTALFFFSGHGGHFPDAEEATHWLLPWEADPRRLPSTALSGQELSERLRAVAAERLVVLFDCCFAAGAAEAKSHLSAWHGFKSGLRERYFERLAEGRGRVILASSREDEVSLVLEGMRNSLFTHYLLEGLRGAARTRGDGLIRVLDLFDYVSEKVPAHERQHPILKTATETNFPIALWRGGDKGAAAPDRRSASPVDKRALREAMVRAFSMEDLQLLCADVEADLAAEGIERNVDLEMFGGQGRPAKVLHLIEHLDHLRLLPVLIQAVQRHRPGLLGSE